MEKLIYVVTSGDQMHYRIESVFDNEPSAIDALVSNKGDSVEAHRLNCTSEKCPRTVWGFNYYLNEERTTDISGEFGEWNTCLVWEVTVDGYRGTTMDIYSSTSLEHATELLAKLKPLHPQIVATR